MRIDLDAKVKTADGHDAGRIHRAIIDPKTERITGFVVSTGRLLGRDVIVDEHALADATPSGDTITLSLTKQELDGMPTFEDTAYVLPPAGWTAPALGYSVPPTLYMWPAEPVAATPAHEQRPTIKKGDGVKDRDGDVVGVVDEIQLDESTGEVLSFVVRAGAGLERLFGGGKLAEVARDDVLRVTEGEVRLGVDREEIVPREQETGPR